MIALAIIGLYLLTGIVFTKTVSMLTDSFNYEPDRSQVSPNALKFLSIIFWPIPVIHTAFIMIWRLFSGVLTHL